MSDLIFSIEPPGLTQGLAPDLPEGAPPIWDQGNNIVFREGSINPAAGQFLLIGSESIEEAVTGLLSTLIAGASYLFIGTPSKLFRWTESTNAIAQVGSGFGGTVDDYWSLARWGDWMVATNGEDAPQIYKGTSFAALSGVTFTKAEIMLPWPGAPFMLALETTGGAEGGFGRIHWCDRDDVETWQGTLSNFAGFNVIRNLDSALRSAIAVGGLITAFSSDGMYVVQFLGHPFVFGVDKLAGGIGSVGKNAVCAVGTTLFGFGVRGIWTADLTGAYRYFDVPLVRDTVLGRVDRGRLHKVVAWHNRAEHHVVFFYPTVEDGSGFNVEAVAYNYIQNNWTFFGYGRQVVDDHGILSYAVAGDVVGNVYYQAAPGQLAGSPSNISPPGIVPVSEGVVYRGGYGIGPYGAWLYG